MGKQHRRQLAAAQLRHAPHGPGAGVEAERAALSVVADARMLVLVEGASDAIALETLARRDGRDLEREGVLIVPMNGAQAIGRYMERFGPAREDRQLTGLCDVAEQRWYERAVLGPEATTMSVDDRSGTRPGDGEAARIDDDGVGGGVDGDVDRGEAGRAALAAAGFFVCDRDLEDELIRATDPARIAAVVDQQGETSSLRAMQRQPHWRDRPFEQQFHRWLRAGARRNLRYAQLLAEACASPPPPLRRLVDATRMG